MAWTRFVSLELSDEDKINAQATLAPALRDQPDFPYGLRICLTDRELKKLKLKPNCNVGDYIDMRAMGRVTCVSKDEVNGSSSCRVEIQIEDIALENESDEEPDEESDEED